MFIEDSLNYFELFSEEVKARKWSILSIFSQSVHDAASLDEVQIEFGGRNVVIATPGMLCVSRPFTLMLFIVYLRITVKRLSIVMASVPAPKPTPPPLPAYNECSVIIKKGTYFLSIRIRSDYRPIFFKISCKTSFQ